MATRDTVTYNSNVYAVIDAAGTPTVYLMNGRRRSSEVTGQTKTDVLAALSSQSNEVTKVTIGTKSSHPTNYAELFVDKDTGELYEYTGPR